MTHAGWHGAAMVLAAGMIGSSVAGAVAEGSLNPMALVEKASLADFIQKPLFDPSRSLPPEAPPPVHFEAPPPVAVVLPPPVLHLIGVIHGRRDMAVVHRDGGDRTEILRTGDQINGWTVTVRPPNAVSLKSGTRVSDYALFSGPPLGVEPVGVAARAGAANGTKVSEAHAATEQDRP